MHIKRGDTNKEHKRDVKTLLEEKKYTQARKKDSLMEMHPSPTIDWVGEMCPTRDSDWSAKGLKEEAEIRNKQEATP